MKIIKSSLISQKLSLAIDKALVNVESEACNLIKNCMETESNEVAKWSLEQILQNNSEAANTGAYACQDTGLAVIFVKIGQDVHVDGNLTDAINEGVRQGYKNARKSVAHPLTRLNTLDNTPAIIHTFIESGSDLEITFLAKGAGSENMSKLYMLTPSKGRQGIIDSVLDCVRQAGANPCPPIVIGIGIGGNMEKCAMLSKLALTRTTGLCNRDVSVANLEKEILAKVNDLKIGAQGFGGDTTALAVAIETFPTHIGMLPVAVNIQCHSVRHSTIKL